MVLALPRERSHPAGDALKSEDIALLRFDASEHAGMRYPVAHRFDRVHRTVDAVVEIRTGRLRLNCRN